MNWRPFFYAAIVLSLALILAGCGKSERAAVVADPEASARLEQLTKELHHTMAGRKLNRNFEEFVALDNLEVPAPPSGMKYAISEKWQVILVKQ